MPEFSYFCPGLLGDAPPNVIGTWSAETGYVTAEQAATAQIEAQNKAKEESLKMFEPNRYFMLERAGLL